jgi:hypothetical protein
MALVIHPKHCDVWSSEDILGNCPQCGAFAIVELTPRLKAIQPDGTTHVCHPGFNGCNHGFEMMKPLDSGRASDV